MFEPRDLGDPTLPRATGSVVHAGGLPGGCLINLGARSLSLSDLASGLNLYSQTALDGARRQSSDLIRHFFSELCCF